MCDLGHGIFEDGKIKGLEEGKIRTLIQFKKRHAGKKYCCFCSRSI